MVLASHAIFTAYGFWLPNDPRGSWSDWIRAWHLLRFGPATKVATRRSVARTLHDGELRRSAKQALRYPPVCFTGRQAVGVAAGIAQAAADSGYVIYACSILPTHVHAVIARHQHKVEQIVGHFKGRASRRLCEIGMHPFAAHRSADGTLPSPWARRGWRVYLSNRADIIRAIRYVEENPLKEGKKPQRWSFVTPRK